MMVGILVQIGAALRAQSQAIRLAQRLQRQFLDQRVAQKRLNIGPGSAFKQRIRILRLVFAGDNVDFLFLDAALAVLPPLPDATLADLSSYGKNEVTFTVQSRLIGFRQRVHSACTGH